MRTNVIVSLGNSISAGYWVANPANQLQNVFLTQCRNTYPGMGKWELRGSEASSAAPRFGDLYNFWERLYKNVQPDVVLIQCGENEPTSTVASIANTVSVAATRITFNAAPTAGYTYLINDGTNEEAVIVMTVSGSEGTRVVRGAYGTTPRNWPAATPVLAWAMTTPATAAAWRAEYTYLVRHILKTSPPGTAVLVGGEWFCDQGDTANLAIAAMVAQLQGEGYNNLEFCPYVTATGASISKSGSTVTSKTIYSGPTAFVAKQVETADSTAVLTDVSDIHVGDLLVFTNTPGVVFPEAAASTVMQVASKVDATNTVTFDLTSINTHDGTDARNKLQSINTVVFAEGARVCKVVNGAMKPRAPWLTIGAGQDMTSFLCCQCDTHPNDLGQREIGYAYFRGYQRVLARMR